MGQIKNIKLHIVTDIKNYLAFRGARALSSLGQQGVRCTRLHQRRIVALGLTSACQVIMKKQALLDSTTVPVNKYDLCTNGLLSNSLVDLVKEALAVDDEESALDEGEDSEMGILRLSFPCFQHTITLALYGLSEL